MAATVHRIGKQVDPPSGGGDNGGMDMTERIVRVEENVKALDTRLGLVERDLRDLGKKLDAHFYWILAAMVGLAGLMAKGFHWF